jgi:hypothetical protein
VNSKSCYDFFNINNNNNAKLQYTLACYQDSDGKSGVFFCAKFRQNLKNERGKFLSKFSLIFQKIVKFPTEKKKNKSQNFCPHLDSNFSLVAFLKTI